MRLDALDELVPQRAARHGQRGLHDVVPVRVHEQPVQKRRVHDLAHHGVAVRLELVAVRRALQALLHDVAGKLLRGELGVGARQPRHHLGVAPGQVQVEHVLHHVVPERVLRQRQGRRRDGLHQRPPLRVVGVVHAPLQHAAAVPVRGDLHAVALGGVVHELILARAEPLQAPLHDVVAVQVLDERHHTRTQRRDQKRDLLGRARRLHQLLHRARAVRVERHGDEKRRSRARRRGVFLVARVFLVAAVLLVLLLAAVLLLLLVVRGARGFFVHLSLRLRDRREHGDALLVRAALQQLLHEVVPERVHHELHSLG